MASHDLTPIEWRNRLLKDVREKRDRLQRLRDYMDGDHDMAFVTEKWRQAFGDLLEELQDNWLSVIVEVVLERMNIQGFEPVEEADPDKAEEPFPFDRDAEVIADENDYDIVSDEINEDALVYGRGYALVSPPADDETDVATITREDPLCCAVATHPANARRRLAGLKVWVDEFDGHAYANVYLPDRVHRWRTTDEVGDGGVDDETDWEELDEPLENPAGVVQLIPVDNVRGRSDIEQFIPVQDAINKLMSDMLVGSEFAAYPQRIFAGVELPETEAEKDRAEIKAAITRMMLFENKDTKWGEFSAADLGNFTKAIETLVQHLASRSHTPPHYLLGSGTVFPTGESLKGSEVSLVAKSKRRMKTTGVGHRETFRTSKLMVAGGQGVKAGKPIWADPEYRTEGERVDALSKLRPIGMPRKVIWKKYGASPQEVVQWEKMRRDEALEDGLTLGLTPNGVVPEREPVPVPPEPVLA